jgi:DNA helicase-4
MSILVVGRNNNDVNQITNSSKFTLKEGKIIYKDNPSIQITYLTVHRSKGLEESNIIIINLTNKTNGFPNQITNNEILRYVTCQHSVYPFDEERRLFYVALTRTKNKVYLLVPTKNESVFVKEIKKNYKKQIKIIRHIK